MVRVQGCWLAIYLSVCVCGCVGVYVCCCPFFLVEGAGGQSSIGLGYTGLGLGAV